MTAGFLGLARSSEIQERADPPTATVQETSRPVFDTELFKEKPAEVDPFLEKFRRQYTEFYRDQQERRLKYITKLRRQDLEPEELQKKLAGFHQKQLERQEKFVRKQNKKMRRYQEKKGL